MDTSESIIEFYIKEKRLFIDIRYERGNWMYLIHQLPSESDIKFATESDCQDKDLWLDSELINKDWFNQENKTYEKALGEALRFIDNQL